MLVVSDRHFQASQESALATWLAMIVPEAARRHPQWAEQVGRSGVEAVCREIEAFSAQYEFSDEARFWDLLAARIADPELLCALTEFQIFAVSRKHASEKLRLQRFLEDKARGSHTVLVRLDTVNQEGA